MLHCLYHHFLPQHLREFCHTQARRQALEKRLTNEPAEEFIDTFLSGWLPLLGAVQSDPQLEPSSLGTGGRVQMDILVVPSFAVRTHQSLSDQKKVGLPTAHFEFLSWNVDLVTLCSRSQMGSRPDVR